MARCLIIGCGCRGRLLAGELSGAGVAVRGTTRDPARLLEIEAAGAEAVLADPDRVGTLVPQLAQVGVVAILLGSARGGAQELAALHGPRLQALLGKLIDTPVRGVVYESCGSVDAGLLSAGAELARSFAARTHARCELLEAEPEDPGTWLPAARLAVERALGPR